MDNRKTSRSSEMMTENCICTWSLQVENTSNEGTAGIYPIYIDNNNYANAGLNSNIRKFDVRAVKDGKTIFTQSLSINDLKTHYADAKYTDSYEKGYTFNLPTLMNEIWLNRVPVNNDNLFIIAFYVIIFLNKLTHFIK